MFGKARYRKITVAACIDLLLECAQDFEELKNRTLTQPQHMLAHKELEKKYDVNIVGGARIDFNASLDEVFRVVHVGFLASDPQKGWMDVESEKCQGHSVRATIELGRISLKKAAQIQIGQAVRIKGDCCIGMYPYDSDSMKKNYFVPISPKKQFSWSFV